MICKYCGQKMDPSDAVCPHCHNPATPLIGGNGFWDMGAEPHMTSEESAAAPESLQQFPVPPVKKSASRGVVALALVLSIASTALTSCNYFSLRSALKEQEQELNAQTQLIIDQSLALQEQEAALAKLEKDMSSSLLSLIQKALGGPEEEIYQPDITDPTPLPSEAVEPVTPEVSDMTEPADNSAATEGIAQTEGYHE